MIDVGVDLSNLPDQCSPEAGQVLAQVEGRELHIDADSLAYRCAGSDECPAGVARNNMLNKISLMKRAAGAQSVVLDLTHGLGDKGGRFAVAMTQEYQGQRNHSRRPKNWNHLREVLERDTRAVNWLDREADDALAAACYNGHVICTPDKDMRQCVGWHLDWNDLRLFWVYSHIATEGEWKDRCWGAWMLLYQCIAGDDADHIPGLPYLELNWVYEYRPDLLAKANLKKMDKLNASGQPLTVHFDNIAAGPKKAVEFLAFYEKPSVAAQYLIHVYRAWFDNEYRLKDRVFTDFAGNPRPEVTGDTLLMERLMLLGLIRFPGDHGVRYFTEILQGEHDQVNHQPDSPSPGGNRAGAG